MQIRKEEKGSYLQITMIYTEICRNLQKLQQISKAILQGTRSEHESNV